MTLRLVGDVGGTNARFALADDARPALAGERTLLCAEFPDLGAAVRRFLDDAGSPAVREAAVAVATPVTGDTIKLTNNPWTFSVEETRRTLGLDRLVMVNDFTAMALSLPLLGPEECRQVGGGHALPGAPIGLIGAGTGLGVSGLLPAAGGWVAVEGEGGHTAFSPANAREAAVLGYLWQRFDHVSTERVCSGPGLAVLHEALCAIDGVPVSTLAPEEVTRRAGTDPYCSEALDMFCGILGTAAANLCVTLGARGGVFIGGGVVPALGERFDRSAFRARFEAKGRFRAYVSQVSTRVITAQNPALRGVAQVLRAREAG